MLGNKVLILDDERAVATTVARAVESLSFEAIVAESAEHFFELLTQYEPEFVIIDLSMPDMDGVEVLIELESLQCRSKIIILSGLGAAVMSAAIRSAREHNLITLGCLGKPFLLNDLKTLLNKKPEFDDSWPKPSDSAVQTSEPSYEELRQAIEQGELFVVYQPKILRGSGEIAGFEALVRWKHPERGLIFPDDFIPIAENSDLIDPLTFYVVDEALQWYSKHFSSSSIQLSINVSARNLRNVDFADRLAAMCHSYKFDLSRLICEITETSVMDDSVKALTVLTRIRIKGMQLSLDDFGTGYSSMQQLMQLPFSEIKIDKSFVFSVFESDSSLSVVESVLALGAKLGLRTSAEGIENQEVLQHLSDLGCDMLQGYFIARPMNGEQALEWVSNYQPHKLFR
ncbi:MAG: EAL domain-containing response regulator [Pseudohongiellaceae bacterium]|nr:EAL domain-containing response regulator [Pseudohongiellaceae bacterium]